MIKQEILLIDDDTIFLMLHKRILLSLGVKQVVKSFSDDIEAIRYIESSENDVRFLIFLDVNLANSSARDFLNIILEKQLNSKIYVIIASSSVSNIDFKIVDDYDCVFGFIEKPITKVALNEISKTEIIQDFF